MKNFLQFVLVAILLMLLLASCSVTKAKSNTASDIATVKKADSGTVKVSENESKTNAAWWRETLLYARPKDTIEKQPIYYNTTNPIQIIREGGTMAIDTRQKNLDSSWKATVDSLRNILTATQSTKETSVLSPWQIMAIGACAMLLLFFITKIKLR